MFVLSSPMPRVANLPVLVTETREILVVLFIARSPEACGPFGGPVLPLVNVFHIWKLVLNGDGEDL